MKKAVPSRKDEAPPTRGPLARDLELSKQRPPVPGKAIEYIYLPARGFMKGRLVKKGQVIRVIDLEGQQCFDCVIWDASNFENVLNCSMSKLLTGKFNQWEPGDPIYSKHCDILAIISDDTTDGMHPFGGAFCTEEYWLAMVGIPSCPNCRDNLVAAMADYFFSAKDIDWNSCISFFMNYTYNTDGTTDTYEVGTKPGDYIDLMAEMDIIVAISNCPAERTGENAYNPTPLQAVIYEPNADYISRVTALKAEKQYRHK
jgi:uncharacterized protein YcgI (DUF1989 family)